MASQMDANNPDEQPQISLSKTDAKVSQIYLPSTPSNSSQSEWYYDMSKKGKAILFNHYKYSIRGNLTTSKRTGTNRDTCRLKEALEKLNFDVEVHNDPELAVIENELKKASKHTKDEISCLMIIVMTHGDQGILTAYDFEYKVETLWQGFTSQSCPKLAGVPKLFFIQACRGDKVDSGYTVCDGPEDQPKAPKKLPSMADILQMYSTYEDHVSWREDDGTWFIQSLCEVFENEADKWDLGQLLTFVIRKVALEYESYTIDPESNRMKQIPQIVSMLTKLLKFKTCQ